MQERKTVTKALAEQCQKARKKEKGRLLGQFVQATGYYRAYAAWLLRNYGRRAEAAPGLFLERGRCRGARRARPRMYGPDVVKALRTVWKIEDCPCGKRLAAALPWLIPRLRALGKVSMNRKCHAKLQRISAATIDRLLKEERERHTLKHRGGAKPGTWLKRQDPHSHV